MFRRTFEENQPHITFAAFGQQRVTGNFVPGTTVAIDYDPGRIPGAKSITAFYQFMRDGAVSSKQLEVTTGQIVERYSDDPVEATMLTTTIEIPADAWYLTIWFSADNGSWDSDNGRNYMFRFTSIDIQGEHASVVGQLFRVELTAAPFVDSVAVNYAVINNPSQQYRGSIPLNAGDLENGRLPWSAENITVPNGATVQFAFAYSVDGRQFLDDNDGQGFYAPKPLPTHSPAAYLAALKEREA